MSEFIGIELHCSSEGVKLTCKKKILDFLLVFTSLVFVELDTVLSVVIQDLQKFGINSLIQFEPAGKIEKGNKEDLILSLAYKAMETTKEKTKEESCRECKV